jgi:hypothetical protein
LIFGACAHLAPPPPPTHHQLIHWLLEWYINENHNSIRSEKIQRYLTHEMQV